ncbi:MAG: hypothetical protein O2877_01720, partial [bacterium]|nr:hypothetical protein [bacterium]
VVRLKVDDLPDCVDAATDEILNSPMHDEELDRDFSIVSKELSMYKDKRWPLPRRHFIRRLTDLVRHSNSPFPIDVECRSCKSIVKTYKNYTFTERTLYCMKCYNEFIEKN